MYACFFLFLLFFCLLCVGRSLNPFLLLVLWRLIICVIGVSHFFLFFYFYFYLRGGAVIVFYGVCFVKGWVFVVVAYRLAAFLID